MLLTNRQRILRELQLLHSLATGTTLLTSEIFAAQPEDVVEPPAAADCRATTRAGQVETPLDSPPVVVEMFR